MQLSRDHLLCAAKPRTVSRAGIARTVAKRSMRFLDRIDRESRLPAISLELGSVRPSPARPQEHLSALEISCASRQMTLFRLESAVAAALLGCLALSACGGSTSHSSSASKGSASSSAKAAGVAHLASLRGCLRKHGVPIAGSDSAVGTKHGKPEGISRPKGVSEARYRAALSGCGVTASRGSGSDSSDATLASFARCMRAAGIDLSNPNTSGRGPLFDTKGLDADGSKFKSASNRCRGELKRAADGGSPARANSSGP
jgi:hypothetical protein